MPQNDEIDDIELETLTGTDNIDWRALTLRYASVTNNDALSVMALTYDGTTNDNAFREALALALAQDIQGSMLRALGANTVAFFSSFMMMLAANPTLSHLTNLSEPLKLTLSCATSLTAAAVMIPMGKVMDESGGKKELLIIRGVSAAGGVGLILYSSVIDLATIRSFDLRYASLYTLFSMMGVCIPTFLLSTNLMYWSPIKKTGTYASIYAGLGGTAMGGSQLLLQSALGGVRLPIIYTTLTSILVAGGAIFAKFGVASPYHQLRALSLSDADAKQLAGLLNQERFPLVLTDSYLKTLAANLIDLRTLALILLLFSSAGASFSSIIRMQRILCDQYQLAPSIASLITGLGSLCVPVTRLFTGWGIDKLDPSKGTYTMLLSSSLIFAPSLAMAIFRSRFNLPAVLTLKFITDIAIGVSSATYSSLLARLSNNPDNPALKPYNIGTVAGITGAAGQASGLLPLIIALIVYANEKEGYYNSFYLTAAITLLASAVVYMAHLQREKPLTSFARSWCGSFREAPRLERARASAELVPSSPRDVVLR